MAASTVAGPEIERLIQLLAACRAGPALGAARALHLIKKRETLLTP